MENDIALLKLSTKIVFNSNNKIAPVCLPQPDAAYNAGTIATVTGWGALAYGK